MLDYSKFSFLSTIAVMQYIFHMFICIMVYWECRDKGGSNFHLALFLARITSEQSMFSLFNVKRHQKRGLALK